MVMVVLMMPTTIDNKQALRRECQGDEMRVAEMDNEIKVMSQLHHPNIINYVGSFRDHRDGHCMIAMELADGGSLNQRLGFVPKFSGSGSKSSAVFNLFYTKDSSKRLSYCEMLRLAYELADALHYLHEEAIPGGQ